METCASCNKPCGTKPLTRSRCRAVPYCSVGCQRKAWKQHQKICSSLNVGKAQQIRHPDHAKSQNLSAKLMAGLATFSTKSRQLFAIFMSEDPSNATLAKMKTIASQIDLVERESLMFLSIGILLGIESKLIKRPTSPLLILLDSGVNSDLFDSGVGSDFLSHPPNTREPDENSITGLHFLTKFTESDESIFKRQVILAKQLIGAGADVNARASVSYYHNSPLHFACASSVVNNIDLVQLFLDSGSNPNQQNLFGETPLMYTMKMAMPVAKLLLTYDSKVPIDVNVRTVNGSTFLGGLNDCIEQVQRQRNRAAVGIFDPGDEKGWTNVAQYDYLLQQTKEVQQLLIERNAIDGGWANTSGIVGAMRETAAAHKSSTPALSYDIGILLDKDLSKNAPDWYKKMPSYVDDEVAKQFQVLKRKEFLNSYDGRPPAVGQLLLIEVAVSENEIPGRLSGNVTAVGPLPTEKQLRRSNSYLYKRRCHCRDPSCSMTRTGKLPDILAKYGTLNGQEVQGVVSLAKEYHTDSTLQQFFRGKEAQYQVVLRCDDHRPNMWQVIRFSTITKAADDENSLSDNNKKEEKKPSLVCAHCQKHGKFKCAACASVYYCSKECQIAHWKLHHKKVCKK